MGPTLKQMKPVLIKIKNELEKEVPDLSYIRGMLEVLIGEDDKSFDGLNDSPITKGYPDSGNKVKFTAYKIGDNITAPVITSKTDEASILDARAAAHIARHGKPKLVTE